MDKIGLQIFRLDNNLNNTNSNEGDIFGSLFSIPMIENNHETKLNEFVFPSKNFDFSDNEKLKKLFHLSEEDQEKIDDVNIVKNKVLKVNKQESQDKNSILPFVPQNKKNPVKYEFKVNFNQNSKFKKKLTQPQLPLMLKKSKDTLNNLNNEDYKGVFVKNSNIITKNNLNPKKHDATNLTNEKYKFFNQTVANKEIKLLDEENEINDPKTENSIAGQKLISLNKENEVSKLNVKRINDNVSHNLNNLIKVDGSNQNNEFSNQQNFNNNDRNINFLLDNFIEELNMSEKGWTEKLIFRVEKALSEGTEEIELFLKPKELGSLKINLQLNKNNAKILFKAENNFVIHALQQSEGLLSKLFNDQGMNIETTHYQNNNFSSNSNLHSNNKQDDKKQNSNVEQQKELQNNDQQKEMENTNYIINVNA